MDFAADVRARTATYRVLSYDSLDSTNSEAMRLARAGEHGPLWVVARQQTAGRGRRGRAWISNTGNLTASLLLTLQSTPAEAAMLGFSAGLAVLNVCRSLAPNVMFTLKWPNDVLANGHKIAGLLLETESRAGSLDVVIGFGVNLAGAPQGMSFPATSFAELGFDVTAETFFAALTDAWADLRESHGSGQATFEQVRLQWMQAAHGLCAEMSVRMGDRIETGIFEMIDGNGRLVLRKGDGSTCLVSAGDVYFGSASSAGAA